MKYEQEFAKRAAAAMLASITVEPDDVAKLEPVLAGAWLAFDAALKQQHAKVTTDANRANHMPPFVEEVQEYLEKIDYTVIEAQHFIDFYQTRGWKISKGVPMKDWKSALRNWKREGWGYRPNQPKVTNQRPQMASLGALQIQLEKVRQEIANIVRPGGSAHPRLASSIGTEEMKRYNDLVAQRDGLVKRINEFTT